jgi:hypothetical protein
MPENKPTYIKVERPGGGGYDVVFSDDPSFKDHQYQSPGAKFMDNLMGPNGIVPRVQHRFKRLLGLASGK